MTAPLIELRRIDKTFLTEEIETRVLSGVDLTIEKGEYVAIAGPSGCGKSTLLSILGLLDVPTAGEYLLEGVPVRATSPAELSDLRNAKIGFIFQNFNLIGDLTVRENVALPLVYRRNMTLSERRAAVDAALARVEMSARAGHYPWQLSGGQQQRVAVARAIVGKPTILLADEPTGNLDSRNGELVMQLIQQLHTEDATICMVTHDPRYADHAPRRVHLYDGVLVDEAIPTLKKAAGDAHAI
jgi:putative ABC transport system ATP-binding protein